MHKQAVASGRAKGTSSTLQEGCRRNQKRKLAQRHHGLTKF
ncbi:hypothetical protein ACQJBY_030281 [Aegilops geniculata]